MLNRCPKCGHVYSSVRNICHLCKDHFIFFGALLNGDRREYQWNCETNSITAGLKHCPIESKTKSNLNDTEIMTTQKVKRKWNCICLSD